MLVHIMVSRAAHSTDLLLPGPIYTQNLSPNTSFIRYAYLPQVTIVTHVYQEVFILAATPILLGKKANFKHEVSLIIKSEQNYLAKRETILNKQKSRDKECTKKYVDSGVKGRGAVDLYQGRRCGTRRDLW